MPRRMPRGKDGRFVKRPAESHTPFNEYRHGLAHCHNRGCGVCDSRHRRMAEGGQVMMAKDQDELAQELTRPKVTPGRKLPVYPEKEVMSDLRLDRLMGTDDYEEEMTLP